MIRFGRAFGDMVGAFSKKTRHKAPSSDVLFSGLDTPNQEIGSWETLPFYAILFLSIFVIFFRLFHIQIVQGEANRKRADQNRITVVDIPAPRGVIFDRNGEVLARNIPRFLTHDKESKLQEVNHDEALKLEAEGKEISFGQMRNYPNGGLLAHVLGYTGEVTQEEITQGNQKYKLGDQIGKSGLEKQYEQVLSGINGRELIETDALGKKLRVLQRIEPVAGKNVTTTISLPLSRVVQEALSLVGDNSYYTGPKEISGAVVISDPRTGEILSMVSTPSFDPNSFTKNDEETIFAFLNDTVKMPMMNRAIAGIYPPGSTFKIITTTAGLEEGKITAQTKIEDVGSFSIGEFSFPNWYFIQYGKKEGMLDVIGAIRRSNDIFFYKTAEMLGIENLERWMKKFNLGIPLGIDIPGEGRGIVPSDAWKKENFGEGWYLGDTYHLGIGQGYLLVTPIQVDAWTGVIANGGKLCKPHLKQIQNSKIKMPKDPEKIPSEFNGASKGECKDLALKKETIDVIKEGMKEACSLGGTGWPLFDFKVKTDSTSVKDRIDGKNFIDSKEGWVKIPVACKTGTAEFGDSQKRTHAWFTTFAPVENPEIAITILVEKGGEGSNVAAPVAKKILEYYFR